MRLRLAVLLGIETIGCMRAGNPKVVPKVPTPNGVAGDPGAATSSAEWDVSLPTSPAAAQVKVTEAGFLATTVGRGDLATGVYTIAISVDRERAAQGSAVLAQAASETWRVRSGAEVAAPTEVRFLGLEGQAFAFRLGDTAGLEVWATSGRCTYSFLFLLAGDSRQMREAAGTLLRGMHPLGGPAAAASPCRL